MIPTYSRLISKGIFIVLLFAINSYADGIDDTVFPLELIPVPANVPALDRPVQINAEGRAERWNPQTGQWQLLGSDLRFDPDQNVYLNQLGDGRILFFTSREGGGTPEYNAIIWNPQSNKTEKLTISVRPKYNTDVAVLADGRVLIINGSEGSTDIWDSRTNTVEHNEVPLLENSRWRALQLRNKLVLLIEMFSDDPSAIRKNVKSSVVLFWNPKGGEWKQIADLPIPFRNGGVVKEMGDGSVQAIFNGQIFSLSKPFEDWEGRAIPAQASPETNMDPNQYPVVAPTTGSHASPASIPSSVAKQEIPYLEAVRDDLHWLTNIFPLLILAIWVRVKRNDLPYAFRSAAAKFEIALALAFFFLLAWILVRHAPLQMFKSAMTRWWENYRDYIAMICLVLSVTVPIGLYLKLRQMEPERLAKILNSASKVVVIFITSYIFLNITISIADNYSLSKLNMGVASDDLSWPLFIAAVGTHKWVLLAVLFPIGLYFQLRRLRKEKLELLVNHSNTAIRAIVVGFFAVLILWNMYARTENNLANSVRYCSWPTSLNNAWQWTECVEAGNGMLESLLFKKTKDLVLSLPSTPCQYVGSWSTTRLGSEYKVTLTDDSRYITETLHDKSGGSISLSGFWGARDDKMVWIEDHKMAWPLDINTILPESRSSFALIDATGERADYKLIDAIKSNNCTL